MLSNCNSNMNKFERVLISSIYKRTRRVEVRIMSDYFEQTKNWTKKDVAVFVKLLDLKNTK